MSSTTARLTSTTVSSSLVWIVPHGSSETLGLPVGENKVTSDSLKEILVVFAQMPASLTLE